MQWRNESHFPLCRSATMTLRLETRRQYPRVFHSHWIGCLWKRQRCRWMSMSPIAVVDLPSCFQQSNDSRNSLSVSALTSSTFHEVLVGAEQFDEATKLVARSFSCQQSRSIDGALLQLHHVCGMMTFRHLAPMNSPICYVVSTTLSLLRNCYKCWIYRLQPYQIQSFNCPTSDAA